MSEKQVNNVLSTTIEKIKEVVDVNTVIGDPIHTSDGSTIIPVSKVKYGFASGGSDLPTKKDGTGDPFIGGAGAGVTIEPVAFLAVSNGEAKILQIEPYNNAIDRAIEKVPDIMDKISALLKKGKGKEEAEEKNEDKS